MIATRCSYVLRSSSRVLRQNSNRKSYSQSSLPPDTYDVVCVGGGPAGLSLLAALSKLLYQIKVFEYSYVQDRRQ
jgi:ribulose 1,5-bisphosphate synthetase/thiazole synthase